MNCTYIKIWIGVFFAALLMAACGPGKAEREQKQQEDLAKEVIGIHDEVMPRMGELVKLRKQLKEKINEWTADSAGHASQIANFSHRVADLDSADKAMMDWMHEYNGGQGIYDHEEIMAYLNEEKVKITAVKDFMNASMESAKKSLAEEEAKIGAEKTLQEGK